MGLFGEMLRTGVKPSAIATDIAWLLSTVKKNIKRLSCPRLVRDPQMQWSEHDQLKPEEYMDDISTRSLDIVKNGLCARVLFVVCYHAVQAHLRVPEAAAAPKGASLECRCSRATSSVLCSEEKEKRKRKRKRNRKRKEKRKRKRTRMRRVGGPCVSFLDEVRSSTMRHEKHLFLRLEDVRV